MGIDADIAPEERGHARTVSDARGRFAKILATTSLNDTMCLRFIDHYGQTMFNASQLPVLLEELQSLALASTDQQDRLHLEQLVALVHDAIERGPGHFVRFDGD